MTQLTQEEIRDSVLSLYEEHEEALALVASEIEKIEDEGISSFEKKVIAIKNKLIEDITVSDEDLETKYLEEIEVTRKSTLADIEERIKVLVEKTQQTVSTQV